MTYPYPPQHPHQQALYPPPSPPASTHPVDIVVSSLGLVLLFVATGFLVMFSPMAVFIGLACEANASEPAVCTESGATTFIVTLLGSVVVLVVSCLAAFVGLIVAIARGARAWPWVLAGNGAAVLAVLVFAVVTAVLTT